MIAGGWAISLHLRRLVRPHKDVDVAIFREDQGALQNHLEAWQLYVAHEGVLRPWPRGVQLALREHVVWAWRPGAAGGRVDLQPDLELLLDERTGTHWMSRRDPSITLSLEIVCLRGPHNLPYLAPEIVLLYKSKDTREDDHTDFQAALPSLSTRQRAWLAGAVGRLDPSHPWLQRL